MTTELKATLITAVILLALLLIGYITILYPLITIIALGIFGGVILSIAVWWVVYFSIKK